MNTVSICPSCQKTLPEGSPQGLCPECLMKAGFGSASGQPGGNPKFVPPPATELAKLFPQLEVLELVGQGGMGAVYRARQPGLDRLVALKILPPESTADPGFTERFSREARALAKLNHPNIVSVYDFGQAGGLHYFLMEYVDGLNLRQLAQSGRVSPREALQIVPQMCDALQFAHDEGIVHRDIKPENVMVDKKGRVKITDFGLAKLLGLEPDGVQLTGARDVMGTPHYMAPEQMEKPNSVDHRADIYSLGVVFYELLTGELPLGKFAPPSRKVAVDVRLDDVVLHTLEHEPERRYQHASQIKTDVETIAQHPNVSAPPVAGPDRTPEETAVVDAYAQVKGPAIGLVITAALNWIAIPMIALVGFYFAAHSSMHVATGFMVLPLLALLLSGVMFVAGLKMKRLQAYWLCVAGSVLAIIVTPGNIIGLPIGIWSLVVLTQKRVRHAFGKDLPSRVHDYRPAGGGGWKVAAVIVAGVMLLLAVPAGLMVAAITLPALQRARARAAELQAAAEAVRMRVETERIRVAEEITINGSMTGLGSEALDLDSGRTIDLPRDGKGSSEKIKWVADQGGDLMVRRVGENRWALATPEGNELKLSELPDDAWLDDASQPEAAPVEAVVSEMVRQDGLVAYVLQTNVQAPITFSFRTASGHAGLLRIAAFGEDPDHAKLQFKPRR